MDGWTRLSAAIVERCVDEQFSRPGNPDSLQCARDRGAYKTAFDLEHTTPAKIWSIALGGALLLDLIATGLLAACVLAWRWIVRGFRNSN